MGGGTLYGYNNNPSNYPETNGTYSWIPVSLLIEIDFSVQGTCPTPTPTPTQTMTPTKTPTQTVTPTKTPTVTPTSTCFSYTLVKIYVNSSFV